MEAQYESEKVETGKVATAVYIYYVKSMGWLLFGCCVTAFTSYQIFATGSSVWLKIWTDSAENLNATDTVCWEPILMNKKNKRKKTTTVQLN